MNLSIIQQNKNKTDKDVKRQKRSDIQLYNIVSEL